MATGIINTIFYTALALQRYPLHPGQPAAYVDLQKAATWADGWMSLMAIIGGIGLLAGKKWSVFAGVIVAAALIHMESIDVAFHTLHGMYSNFDTMMIVMIVVDIWAFGMGSSIITLLWRER